MDKQIDSECEPRTCISLRFRGCTRMTCSPLGFMPVALLGPGA